LLVSVADMLYLAEETLHTYYTPNPLQKKRANVYCTPNPLQKKRANVNCLSNTTEENSFNVGYTKFSGHLSYKP